MVITCTCEWSRDTQRIESIEAIIVIFSIIIVDLQSLEISRVRVLNDKQCHVERKQNAFIWGIQEK